MTTGFEQALERTLGHEGGYANDPKDRGGETMWGITEAVARRHGWTGAMKDLPFGLMKEVYYKDYWSVNRLDDVHAFDPALALELFDTGVNCGVESAAKFLQRAINLVDRGAPNVVAVDGKIGDQTIAALRRFGDGMTRRTLLLLLNCLQGNRYIEIMERNPSQEAFARNWFTRVSLGGG